VNGAIAAPDGGFDFFFPSASSNRVIQARPPPGISLSLLFYSAALEKRAFTPSSIVMDAPVRVRGRGGRDNLADRRNSTASSTDPRGYVKRWSVPGPSCQCPDACHWVSYTMNYCSASGFSSAPTWPDD